MIFTVKILPNLITYRTLLDGWLAILQIRIVVTFNIVYCRFGVRHTLVAAWVLAALGSGSSLDLLWASPHSLLPAGSCLLTMSTLVKQHQQVFTVFFSFLGFLVKGLLVKGSLINLTYYNSIKKCLKSFDSDIFDKFLKISWIFSWSVFCTVKESEQWTRFIHLCY